MHAAVTFTYALLPHVWLDCRALRCVPLIARSPHCCVHTRLRWITVVTFTFVYVDCCLFVCTDFAVCLRSGCVAVVYFTRLLRLQLVWLFVYLAWLPVTRCLIRYLCSCRFTGLVPFARTHVRLPHCVSVTVAFASYVYTAGLRSTHAVVGRCHAHAVGWFVWLVCVLPSWLHTRTFYVCCSSVDFAVGFGYRCVAGYAVYGYRTVSHSSRCVYCTRFTVLPRWLHTLPHYAVVILRCCCYTALLLIAPHLFVWIALRILLFDFTRCHRYPRARSTAHVAFLLRFAPVVTRCCCYARLPLITVYALFTHVVVILRFGCVVAILILRGWLHVCYVYLRCTLRFAFVRLPCLLFV